jgi:trk system potassium uptake protein
MKIVILGCGRVGARLAQLMEEDGHKVSIIDADPNSFSRLYEGFNGQTTLGTGIDVDVLKAAGIGDADAFAAVTNFDNTNIMACEVAKEIFGINKVLARIYDPGRESLYHQLGLETVCPTTLISTTAREILNAPEGVEVLPFYPHNAPVQETGPLSAPARIPEIHDEPLATGYGAPAGSASSGTVQAAQKATTPADDEQQNGKNRRGFFRH